MGSVCASCMGDSHEELRASLAAPSTHYKSMEGEVGVVGAAQQQQPQQQQQPMLVRGPFMYPPAEHTARTQQISEKQQKLVWRKGDALDTQCAYPPKDTPLQEWLAAHLIDFTNCLNSIVTSVYPACSCSAMTAGSAFTYKWQNEHTGDTEDLTARAFIDRAFEFVNRAIKQEVVPQLESSTPVPLNDFEKTCEKVFKQLFRVWAHLLKDHYTTMGELDVMRRAHLAFKWFAFFVVEQKLLTEKEILPLKDTIRQMYEEAGSSAADWERRLSSMGSDPLDL